MTIGALWTHWRVSKRSAEFNATHDVDPGVPMHGAALPQAALAHGNVVHDVHVVHGGAHERLPQAVAAPQTHAANPAPVVDATIITATLVQHAPAAQQQLAEPGHAVPTVVINPAQPCAQPQATQPHFVAQVNATPLG